jgi:group I intron endonuclease
MSIGYIYKITNKINGKHYIGKTHNAELRFAQHVGSSSRTSRYAIHNAIRKYGEESFVFEVIFVVFDYDLDGAEWEIHFIDVYESYMYGYNLTTGGEGVRGYKHTEESRRKNSLAKSGEKHPFFGKPRTEATKAKISEVKKGWGLGRKLSSETKERMSAAQKGKKMPDGSGERTRIFLGTKLEIDGLVYESIPHASEHLGICIDRIKRMIADGSALVIEWGKLAGPNSKTLGKKMSPESTEKKIAKQGYSVRVGETVYVSFNRAYQSLGITSRQLYNLLHDGKAAYIDKETGEIIEKGPDDQRKGPNGIPIIIDGVSYVTRSSAAKATGLSRYLIDKGLRDGTITYDTSVKSLEDISARSSWNPKNPKNPI